MTANETMSVERGEIVGTRIPVHVGATALTGSDMTIGSTLVDVPEPRQRHRQSRRSTFNADRAATVRYMVLASGPADIAAVELRSGAFVRLRTGIFEDSVKSDLKLFDLVDAQLASDPERDDLAHPEAVTIASYPELVGTAPKRWARRRLKALVAPTERNLLGFAGSAAPYWEFRGMRPSLALVAPSLGPLLFRRKTDNTTWVRFGWSRSDNWLPVDDPRAVDCLWASGRERLTGKDLATALGYRPRYLLAALSPPRGGRCYKTVVALLPRP
jgi:hypothetical protein